jgi:hypothetical protein
MATQHLNLFDASLLRPRQRFTLSQLGAAALVTLGLVTAAGAALQRAGANERQQAAAHEARVAELRSGQGAMHSALAASLTQPEAEVKQLRGVEAAQRRVRMALATGEAGDTQGYAEYLLALSRQAHASVWITGLSVSADGDALEITGRMADPSVLPAYLRKLNAEPLFRGRQFARFALKTVTPRGAAAAGDEAALAAASLTEFTLRSQAGERTTTAQVRP